MQLLKMVLDRQGLVEAAIAGAVTGISFACVLISTRFTTDAGDVLGFWGAAVGAGAAVVGSLFVEGVKVSREAARKAQRLEMAIASVITVGATCAAYVPNDEDIIGYALSLRQCLTIFLNAKAVFETNDPDLAGCLEALAHWVPRIQSDIDRHIEGYNADRVSIEALCADLRPLSTRVAEQWLLPLQIDANWTGNGVARVQAVAPGMVRV